MKPSLTKVALAVLSFAGGWLAHWLLASPGETPGRSGNTIATTSGTVIPFEDHQSAAGPKPQQTGTSSVGKVQGEDTIVLPLKFFKNLTRSPLKRDLVPESSFLYSLGVPGESVQEIQAAFSQFKSTLEELEAKNTKLVTDDNGEHFEISPFELPPAAFEHLKKELSKKLGENDWRADFLVASLKSSSFGGGLGKYRQEISIETERDSGGGVFEMLNCKMFNAEGKLVDGSGFEVRPGVTPGRYSKLFESKLPPK